MGKRADNSSVKERILSFVEEDLISVGNIRFSVDEVAAGLGMSKKTFYQAFPTKEAMLEALIRRITGYVGGHVDRIVDSDRTFMEKLAAVTTFLGSIVRRLALPLSSDFQRVHPDLWKLVEEFRTRKILVVFGRLFDQGKAEGVIRGDVDRDIFLIAYSAAIRSVVHPSVLMDQRFTVQDAITQIVALFFRGALTEAGREQFAEMTRTIPSST
ncbi:MAG TPA: TetR/AcrR family transcriptional regulator [Thermoanaerobaculia bacterium]|nr:TetR/AcrR family transcriptional regulator [Thermoanaerobaculia bacterium]